MTDIMPAWKEPVFGERYSKLPDLLGERHYDSAAIAALIRKDIKDAIAAGALPKGLKVSVKTDKFSGGSAIRMRIVECPVPVKNPEHAKWMAENPRGYDNPHERYTLEARQIRERLQAIHGAYNFDNSDSTTDYSHVNYYGRVEFDSALEGA